MCVCLSPSPPPHSLSFSLGKIDWVILLFPPWCRSLASLGEGEAVRAVWRHTGIMIMKERAHTCTVTPEEKRGYLWRESLVKEEHTHHLNYFLSHIRSYFYMDIAGKTEEGFLHYRRILSANMKHKHTVFFYCLLEHGALPWVKSLSHWLFLIAIQWGVQGCTEHAQ